MAGAVPGFVVEREPPPMPNRSASNRSFPSVSFQRAFVDVDNLVFRDLVSGKHFGTVHVVAYKGFHIFRINQFPFSHFLSPADIILFAPPQ
jgi:hypothetical protein